jgi:hypothetical protein
VGVELAGGGLVAGRFGGAGVWAVADIEKMALIITATLLDFTIGSNDISRRVDLARQREVKINNLSHDLLSSHNCQYDI